MPVAISILLLLLVCFVLYKTLTNAAKKVSRKKSWLAKLEVGDKTRVIIPEDEIAYGKITKLCDGSGEYTIEYKVKKDFIYPPFN